jgi:TetR/AcrR family transcriptional regulator
MEIEGHEGATRPAIAGRRSDGTRNPDESRKRILEAARAEFSEHGLGGARVNAIATRAGVNKQLIYYYFQDKDRLYAAVLEEAYREIRLRENALDLDALDPERAMETFIRFNFDFLVKNRHFVALLNDENLHKARHIRDSAQIVAMHETLGDTLGRILERGLASGVFARRLPPMDLYIMIASLSYFPLSNAFTLSAIFAMELATPERHAERRRQAVDMVLCFLRTSDGDSPEAG